MQVNLVNLVDESKWTTRKTRSSGPQEDWTRGDQGIMRWTRSAERSLMGWWRISSHHLMSVERSLIGWWRRCATTLTVNSLPLCKVEMPGWVRVGPGQVRVGPAQCYLSWAGPSAIAFRVVCCLQCHRLGRRVANRDHDSCPPRRSAPILKEPQLIWLNLKLKQSLIVHFDFDWLQHQFCRVNLNSTYNWTGHSDFHLRTS